MKTLYWGTNTPVLKPTVIGLRLLEAGWSIQDTPCDVRLAGSTRSLGLATTLNGRRGSAFPEALGVDRGTGSITRSVQVLSRVNVHVPGESDERYSLNAGSFSGSSAALEGNWFAHRKLGTAWQDPLIERAQRTDSLRLR